jgi:hypothetical protein
MTKRFLALALCALLAACETTDNPRSGRSDLAAQAVCNPGNSRQRDAIDDVFRAIERRPLAQQTPTPQERTSLGGLAETMGRLPEALEPAGTAFCLFSSARAANMAARQPQVGDGGLIDLVAGANGRASSACAAPGGAMVMHCRQLQFFAALGSVRAVAHPLINGSRGPALALGLPALEQGFADYGAAAAQWGAARSALAVLGAPEDEQNWARAELGFLACAVQTAGAVFVGPDYGLPVSARATVERAARTANARAAAGLGLSADARGEADCAADPESTGCHRAREVALIAHCTGG